MADKKNNQELSMSPYAGLVTPDKRPDLPKITREDLSTLSPYPATPAPVQQKTTGWFERWKHDIALALGISEPTPEDLALVRSNAQSDLQRYGKTMEQSTGYLPGVSEAIYHGVDPSFDYYNFEDTKKIIEQFPRKIVDAVRGVPDPARNGQSPELEDAWKMYLGMPQSDNTFSISEYTPSYSTDDSAYYYKFSDPSKLDEFRHSGLNSDTIKPIVDAFDRDGSYVGTDPVMAEYKWGRGQDENGPYLSYYDTWDLAPGMAGNVVGKPFEIYDRIYYDPNTYEPVKPKKTLSRPPQVSKKQRNPG